MENITREFKEFEEELVVSKQLFYNESSMYGAYGFRFANKPNEEIRVHPVYNNFSIAGNVPALVEGKAYKVRFVESYDERRQMDSYTFIEVKSEGLKGREAQEDFMYEVLTANQANSILSNFSSPTIIEDIIDHKIDLTTVKGIKGATATNIRVKLLNFKQYSEAIVKLSPLGVGIKNVVKLSEYFGSPEKLLHIVDTNIYRLTEASGFGFKRVDEFALNNGVTLDDKRRIIAGALYVIEQMVSQGDTKINIEKFEEEMCKILEVEEVTDDVFKKILSHKGIYYQDGIISLKAYYEEEKEIVNHLRRIRDSFNYTEKDNKDIIKRVEDNQGYKFNKEQLSGIEEAVKNGIFILDGQAGSGKTSLLKGAVECVDGYNMSCSLSGKAANVLAQNGLNSSTIHRLLIVDPVTGQFLHNENNPLPHGTYILDEASMVNNKLFLDLVKAIPSGSQLLIVGDSGQLPAIGRGATFDYLLSSKEFAHVTLKEVHRQAQDSGTLNTAIKVRNGQQIASYTELGKRVTGVNNDFYEYYFRDKSEILNEVLYTAKAFAKNPNTNNDEFQVIVGLKEKGDYSVLNMNKYLQEIFNPLKHGQEEVEGAKYVFREGDRVIQQGNNYRAKGIRVHDFAELSIGSKTLQDIEIHEQQVFNGTFGKIVSCVENVGILVKFEDIDFPIFFEKSKGVNEIGVLDLGYAISVHRSQGSGFKTLLVVVTFNEFTLLSRQFLYTALTRTIDRCFLFAESSAVHYAIKTDKGKSRKCFIGDFLN